MKPRSPTIEGFRMMFSRPALGLAEIAWRWTFGAVAILSFTFLTVEYFRTLPISAGDIFLLRTRHPLLITQAVAHIFRGSGVRLVRAIFVLFMLLSVVWIFLASWARTATVTALLDNFREDGEVIDENPPLRSGSPLGLNLLRVFAMVAALLACIAAFVLGRAASMPTDPSAGRAMLVVFILLTGISLAWGLLNWILSLAAIFAVADNSRTLAAISKSVNLWRTRWASIAAAGTWFGLAHIMIFFIASSVVAFPLAFVGVLPAGVVFGGVLLITLLYFAAADFLYAGKMAAYVAIAKIPCSSPISIGAPIIGASGEIDRSELIISDIPAVEG